MRYFIYVCVIVCSSLVTFAQPQDAPALLTQVVAKARGLASMSAFVTLTHEASGTGSKRTSDTFTVRKPNYAVARLSGDDYPRVMASDGTNVFSSVDETTYTKTAVDLRGEKIDTPWWNLPLRFFFTQSINPFGPKPDSTEKISSLPAGTIAGESFRVLSITGAKPIPYAGKLYINKAGVLQRTEVSFGPTTVFSAELKDIKVNSTVTSSFFRFTPQQGAKLQEESATDKLLPLGQSAPEFLLPTPTGAKTSLAIERKNAKAMLINFWYLNCPPCRIEFPDFEKLYEQFHPQGLSMVAVDKDDAPKDVSAYLAKAKLTFPVVLGGPEVKGSVFDHYRVETFPGTYLLDQEGKIVYHAVGVDADGLRAALAKQGFK